PARQRRAILIHNSLDFAANSAEVAVLHRPVNVYDPPDIVMRDYLHLAGPRYRSHIGQYSRAACSGSSDGQVLDVLERLNIVLGGLRHEAIVHPVLPVQKEHGIGLKAAAQRIEHAGGDITESESALGGFGAVDGDVKLGIIELLL